MFQPLPEGVFNDDPPLLIAETEDPLGLGAVALFGHHVPMTLEEGGDLGWVTADQVRWHEGTRQLGEKVRLELLDLAGGAVQETQLGLEALQGLQIPLSEGLQAAAKSDVNLSGRKGHKRGLPQRQKRRMIEVLRKSRQLPLRRWAAVDLLRRQMQRGQFGVPCRGPVEARDVSIRVRITPGISNQQELGAHVTGAIALAAFAASSAICSCSCLAPAGLALPKAVITTPTMITTRPAS